MATRTQRQLGARSLAINALLAAFSTVRDGEDVHPGQAAAFVDALLEAADPQPSDHAAAVEHARATGEGMPEPPIDARD
jgi:hypothetical protein